MYRVWCEWDVGVEDCVFTSVPKAIEVLETNPYIQDAIEETDGVETVSDLIANGLLGFRKLQVI